MKSVSHSTHTRQVPFSSGQVPFVPGQVPFAGGQAKEAEGQLHVGARPGTPLPALPKDQPASQVSLMFQLSTAAYHH